jgi:hypothetical protein
VTTSDQTGLFSPQEFVEGPAGSNLKIRHRKIDLQYMNPPGASLVDDKFVHDARPDLLKRS